MNSTSASAIRQRYLGKAKISEAGILGSRLTFSVGTKKPRFISKPGLWNICLAMTYFHMGRPHTIIGAATFHF